MCKMMAHIGLYDNLKTGICPECMSTANKLDNIMANSQDNKYAQDKLYGNRPDKKNF